ncbi:hypothetical protein [Mesorhizobium sp.]|uniref:hypothetical protein n=1 Tax=Mesorhizobium sp. TaxID=1871066 RepID=UPI0025D5CB74|nr:hypothetical protein [Mesorhizobium sp.]
MFAATEKATSLLGQAVDLGRWLGLAAAPTFALMAWISGVGSAGMTMCSAASPFINDMALMYLLMSLFHVSPWLKLFSARSQHRNTSVVQTRGD